jgi:hypothetical protein
MLKKYRDFNWRQLFEVEESCLTAGMDLVSWMWVGASK